MSLATRLASEDSTDILEICRGQLREHNEVDDGICAAVVETLVKPVSNKTGEICRLE